MSKRSWKSAGRLVLLTALGTACGTPTQLGPDITIMDGDIDGASPVSKTTFLIADNQQQYLYGNPVWIRTALVDRFVASAIRAPQLDLFGPSVMEWVVQTYGEQAPFIHLGDGLNLSCKQEFEAFARTMKQAANGWFMAPGNHDGVYFGSSGSDAEWAEVCAPSGVASGEAGPMNKAEVVDRYLATALARDAVDAGARAFAEWRKTHPGATSWTYNGKERHWLERVAWRIAPPNRAYRSFVVQQLDATFPNPENPYAVKYILLDTADYTHSPELIPVPPHVNAGSTGDISKEQLEVVESWLSDAQNVGEGKPRPVIVLMGHHPFDALRKGVRQEIERLRRAYGVLLYVSAHTHSGGYFTHADEGASWLELNVGSLVDWPLEYREFNVRSYDDKDKGPRLYTYAALNELSDKLEAFGCDPRWQPQVGDADYYVDYRAATGLPGDQTAALVFNSLLASYRRLLGYFPSAPENTVWPPFVGAAPLKSDASVFGTIESVSKLGAKPKELDRKRQLLAALEPFDRTRARVYRAGGTGPANAPIEGSAGATEGEAVDANTRHQQYRLCQAFWASMDDETGARRARRKDWFIAYPPQKAR